MKYYARIIVPERGAAYICYILYLSIVLMSFR